MLKKLEKCIGVIRRQKKKLITACLGVLIFIGIAISTIYYEITHPSVPSRYKGTFVEDYFDLLWSPPSKNPKENQKIHFSLADKWFPPESNINDILKQLYRLDFKLSSISLEKPGELRINFRNQFRCIYVLTCRISVIILIDNNVLKPVRISVNWL